MLQLMRRFVSSWAGILVLVVAVGAMAIVFGQTGGPGGSSSERETVLATVGKTGITDRQYYAAIDRVVAREREQNPGINNAAFLQAGGGEMVLQQMIISEALKAYADANGIVVSRRLVDGEIASIPAFQLNGEFNEATFRRLLDEQNISEAELRDSIAQDLIRRQLLQPVIAGIGVPGLIAENYARMFLEQRQGDILPVPSMLMPDPGKPSDKQLQEFHQNHRDAYTIPERRAFRYAEISAASLSARATPTAEEVRQYYDSHPGEFGGLETREVQQIVLPDAAAARAFVEKVRAGTAFADAAREAGFSARDTAVGTVSEAELAQQLDEAAADAAFALTANSVSDPLPTDFGQRVVHVGAIHPPQAQPFAAVSARIATQLSQSKLHELMSDMVNDAEDRIDDGQSFADVAKAFSLTVQTEAPVTSDGRRFDSEYQVSTVELPILDRVFELDPLEGPRAVQIDDEHYALVEVTDVIAPELVPLDKIRDDVAAQWVLDARARAARAEAEAIIKALNEGQDLARVVAGRKLPPAEALAVRRLELSQMLSQGQQVPPPVMMLLNVPAGKAHLVEAPDGQGWFVVRVNEVQAGADADAKALAENLRQALAQEAGNELAESFLRTIERSAKVVRQPDALKAVNARLTGAFED